MEQERAKAREGVSGDEEQRGGPSDMDTFELRDKGSCWRGWYDKDGLIVGEYEDECAVDIDRSVVLCLCWCGCDGAY